MCDGHERRVKTLVDQELHQIAMRVPLRRRGGRLAHECVAGRPLRGNALAYIGASSTFSRVSEGYPSKISATVAPCDSMSAIAWTGIRVPRYTGAPRIISGSECAMRVAAAKRRSPESTSLRADLRTGHDDNASLSDINIAWPISGSRSTAQATGADAATGSDLDPFSFHTQIDCLRSGK